MGFFVVVVLWFFVGFSFLLFFFFFFGVLVFRTVFLQSRNTPRVWMRVP